ncbi:hypothetical protein [Pseudoclavibacter endophyticus]|uniref:Uncharacterized protein n=1 Tax=Pseudoclavibacter endophyticus TaxID=1778590 RepID=A0A6H9WRA7_9MICO|nr:hypothetical protein [Pseudoclavibacter endophyticus]KAB1649305.1 hypothetical protein F8O04_03260 [Pseudoclavibacter endophyticus]
MIDRETLHGRARALEVLAEAAQAALGAEAWLAGAHGGTAAPRADPSGRGYHFSLSRSCRCEPGADRVMAQAAEAHAALAAAGCEVEDRVFGGGESIWVIAVKDGDQIVVKLASNGNRLVTAESRDYDDAGIDEVATAFS